MLNKITKGHIKFHHLIESKIVVIIIINKVTILLAQHTLIEPI